MAITLIRPLPVGNALRIFITPPTGALWWRVLRRTADAFTGPTDSGAVVVVDESTDNVVLDITALVNGTPYFYRLYSWDGAAWTASATNTGTPAATYAGDDIDPQTLVRDRLEAGLAVEVALGALKPESGLVPVLFSPFVKQDAVSFPCVSVLFEQDGTADRAVGEMLFGDEADPGGGGWTETEGWLSKTTLQIVGVSLNPDERVSLRQAIGRVITANLPVFDSRGLVQINFSQRDREDFRDTAPLFFTDGTLDCMAPSFVQHDAGVITATTTTATPYGMEP